MAKIGFSRAIITVQGETPQTFRIDRTQGGTIEASISGLAAEATTVYASNIPFYISSKGVGETTASLNVFDLHSVDGLYEAVLGIQKDADGISIVGEDTEAPYASVVFVSDNPEGKEMYFGLTKGRFSHPEIALNTSESGGTDPNTETIEGTFVSDARGYVYMSGVQSDTLTEAAFLAKVNATT
jgi:phi13 family phage major tail protein